MALRQDSYWDEHYENELKNFEEGGDEGEIWFGKGLSRKIADRIISELDSKYLKSQGTSLIDIGCGNAFLLLTIIEKLRSGSCDKFRGSMDKFRTLGIDYSANSIKLSKKIVNSKGLNDTIDLEQCDFLNPNQLERATGGQKFDFVVDKGTFDAICLLASGSDSKLIDANTRYMRSLYSLVKEGTIFILASCNYVKEELLALFDIECKNKCGSKLVDKIETPKLQFGGKEGSQVTCLIMRFSERYK